MPEQTIKETVHQIGARRVHVQRAMVYLTPSAMPTPSPPPPPPGGDGMVLK